jgi:hypothetical protein
MTLISLRYDFKFFFSSILQEFLFNFIEFFFIIKNFAILKNFYKINKFLKYDDKKPEPNSSFIFKNATSPILFNFRITKKLLQQNVDCFLTNFNEITKKKIKFEKNNNFFLIKYFFFFNFLLLSPSVHDFFNVNQIYWFYYIRFSNKNLIISDILKFINK